jgi:hypothetical protein
MPVMAKRKPSTADARGPEKNARSGATLNVYVDEDIRQALDEYIAIFNDTAEHKATLRSAVEAALKGYLKDKGHWPRKSAAGQ